MADADTPHFEMGKSYNRDEFVFIADFVRLWCLKVGDVDLAKTMERNIEWANSHPEGSWFVFEMGENGFAYPAAYSENRIKIPPVLPEN